MIWNIIEVLALIGSLAGWLVTRAKLDEQKKLTQEERDRRWDEISLRLTIENEKDAEIEFLKYSLEGEQRLGADREEEIFRLSAWHNIMQDKLSALLCPTNNHVWKDGCCVKCGRMKDAEIH